LNLQSSDYKAGVLTSRPPSLDIIHAGQLFERSHKYHRLGMIPWIRNILRRSMTRGLKVKNYIYNTGLYIYIRKLFFKNKIIGNKCMSTDRCSFV